MENLLNDRINVRDGNGATPNRLQSAYRDPLGRFQYTGQIWIPELGMYHYKSRTYSPTLGRFLQTDPQGYKDQMNLYGYVKNSPMSAVDPGGKDTVLVTFYYSYLGVKLASHSGIYVDRAQGEDVLYDPGGSFQAPDEYGHMTRGSGGAFYGDQADIGRYRGEAQKSGYYVRFTRIGTTAREEEALIKAIEERGDVMDGFCARTCSAVLGSIPGMKDFGTWFPDSLADAVNNNERTLSDTMFTPGGGRYPIPVQEGKRCETVTLAGDRCR